MNATPSIAVVVPFFNEEASVEEVCRELRQVLTDELSDVEVALIDDGSSDGTGAKLDNITRGWPEARVFHLDENKGQSAALLFGFNKTTAPILVTMDGDGQNDPHDIPKLLLRFVEADMVVGVRVDRQDSWMRRQISRIANQVRSDLLGDGVSDAGCALKAFGREVVGAFIPIRTLYSFMPALAVAAGFRVVEEPVHHRLRAQGDSKYSTASFLFLPIVDFIGLRWFRWRRCRSQTASRFEDYPAIGTLGTDLHRRAVARWTRRISFALVAGFFAALLLFARRSAVKSDSREISLARAERAALQLVPEGVFCAEELHTEAGQPRWTIDVQPPGARELREIEVDARGGRVISSRIETPEEEALEIAVEQHHFDPKHPDRR
ncbi:MAG: glycosyltransferase [Chthoniobacterales bacterium]|nr:glycosyltransferase [Chthoniobacterales bacterium]